MIDITTIEESEKQSTLKAPYRRGPGLSRSQKYIDQILLDIRSNSIITNQCEIKISNNIDSDYSIIIQPKNKKYYIQIKFYGNITTLNHSNIATWANYFLYTSQLSVNVKLIDDPNYISFYDPTKKDIFIGWNLWFLWIDTTSIINLLVEYINETNKDKYIFY